MKTFSVLDDNSLLTIKISVGNLASFVRNWRMENHLYRVTCRVGTIKAARTITVSLWRLQNFYLVLHKIRVPRIYVGGLFNHKAYMIQTLRAIRHVTCSGAM